LSHSCILESEIAGYQGNQRPVFSERQFSGESATWKEVCCTPPLPVSELIPGTLVVVNFDLRFRSPEKFIRFRFHGQDSSGTSSLLSTIENEISRIPGRIESAVHVRISEPVERIRLTIEARGRYDLEFSNMTCFATRPVSTDSGFNHNTYSLQPGDRARVFGAVESMDNFWPDDQLSYGWTMGDATITVDDLTVDAEKMVLLLETFGWMPTPWRLEMNRNRLRVYFNGDRRAAFLGMGNAPVTRYYFAIPPDIRTIESIRIISDTFSPRELGLNNDGRALGVDLRSLQFPIKTAAPGTDNPVVRRRPANS
jgi:hypothetical protein